MPDPELDALFRDDPSLRETARLLRAARPDPVPDPYFRNRLRSQLLAEGRQALRPRGARRWLRLGPAHLAWAGAAVGTAAIAATALALFGTHVTDHQTVTAYSTIAARHAVSPSDVITVSFNQPMDHAAVEAGLRIEPATQVTTSWQGDNLVITPVHHLSGNTPYTVTIAKPALVAASGATATKTLQIAFGTAPTPPPAPAVATPPALHPTALGSVAGGSSLLFAPDGSVVSTAGYPPVTGASPAATGSPSPSGSSTPTASGSASPSTSPTAAGPASPALLEYPSSGTPVTLGAAVSAAAFAPGGSTLATAASDGNGGSDIVVSQPDGSQEHQLVDSPAPVVALTWASNDRIVYATAGEIDQVQLSGAAQTLSTPTAKVAALAPGGAYAYLAPGGGQDGQLLDVSTGAVRGLAGATGDAVFSGDGSTLAWVSQAAAQPALLTEPVAQDAAATVSVLEPGANIGALALNRDGTRIAYTLTPAGGAAETVIAQVPSGTAVAVGPAAQKAVFSSTGDQVAFLTQTPSGVEAQVAAISGPATPSSSASVPVAASSTLRAFVDAQGRGDVNALLPLTANGVAAAANTPPGLTRSYIVDATLEPDGTVQASVELIVDGTATLPVRIADESLTLTSSGAGQPYLITGLSITPLHIQAAGPHVLSVNGAPSGSNFVIQISFDSDLNPTTVAAAINVSTADGVRLNPAVVYDADTRTAIITLPAAGKRQLDVTVGSSLLDVNGQSIANAFQSQISG
jgi:Bacterial Ig-like domain